MLYKKALAKKINSLAGESCFCEWYSKTIIQSNLICKHLRHLEVPSGTDDCKTKGSYRPRSRQSSALNLHPILTPVRKNVVLRGVKARLEGQIFQSSAISQWFFRQLKNVRPAFEVFPERDSER
ncbi:hypothetical protein AVEN_101503-1 [Araneus ventricosus]|uniref:Uncharacterized protein n=1 Tax=Araneus ventricosus TaxID=182803 RepID=A0A4Y2F9H1_ARAVE|nr:hypothetical protein AVEN_101503-1 [Araneus ventricosus]